MHDTMYVILLLGLFLFAILFITNQNYNLDSIKRKEVGDGQHGTARFANKKDIRDAYKVVKFEPDKWRKGRNLPDLQGIIVGCYGENPTYAYVDSGDVHGLMIGAAGVGKTAFFLYPNIEYALASGMSFLSTDTKGDVYRNYGRIAREDYGYDVIVLDLRNPLQSDAWNMMNLVNHYMDSYLSNNSRIQDLAKAEKYAKIIAKTIIYSDGTTTNYGQNQFFYDAAEGLLASVILIVAQYAEKKERHIISVYKTIQDLLSPGQGNKSKFQELMSKLPKNHRARWLAGAALNTAEASMQSVLSTALARLNAFLDTEMEQILCVESKLNAENFCKKKTAIFIVLPEEDPTKFFLATLFIQQMYRETLSFADENGGKLPNRVIFFWDEYGTMPAIQSAEMMFSAGRSRRLSIVAIIQSYAQLYKNYTEHGAEIIIDNCQLTIFGGFAPGSKTAEELSKSMGTYTALAGSVSRNKHEPSQSLDMIERPLMTSDELKSMKRGNFIVMKTGYPPMRATFKLFFKWGIKFDKEYIPEVRQPETIEYADVSRIIEKITGKPQSIHIDLRSQNEMTSILRKVQGGSQNEVS